MTEHPTTCAPLDRLWTIQEVAYFLGIPVATLHYWHHLDQGPACSRIGRHLRYRAQDVNAWVDEQAAS